MKRRSFAFIAYPESCQDIDLVCRSCGASKWAYILHDQDFDDDVQIKKPHYHIYLGFPNPVSDIVVKSFGIQPQQVLDRRIVFSSLFRYFLHLDDPDKFQYSADQIVHSSGFDPSKYLDREKSEDEAMLQIMEIIDDLHEQKDYSVASLARICASQGLSSYLRRGSYLYISALRN